MGKILSIICAYFPNNQLLSLLVSVLSTVGDVAIVNNGGKIELPLSQRGNSIFILDYGYNLGTLASYNRVISQRQEYSYYWLWDQDSEISEGEADKFVSKAEVCFNRNDNTVCVTSFDNKNYISPINHNLILAKASTSMISKSHFEKLCIGWFDEKLFMDYGDWDFLYRLFKVGGRVKQISGIHIKHQLGELEKTLLGPVNRSSLMRLHMQGINTAYLVKKHGIFNFPVLFLIVRFFFLPFKNILFSDTMKRNRRFWDGFLYGIKGGVSSTYAANLNKGIK